MRIPNPFFNLTNSGLSPRNVHGPKTFEEHLMLSRGNIDDMKRQTLQLTVTTFVHFIAYLLLERKPSLLPKYRLFRNSIKIAVAVIGLKMAMLAYESIQIDQPWVPQIGEEESICSIFAAYPALLKFGSAPFPMLLAVLIINIGIRNI